MIELRWGYSPEKYEYAEFGTPDEAATYAGGDSFVEVVTVRNPNGSELTFEGRFLTDPADVLDRGATVEGVWYTVPGVDSTYDDFYAARSDASRMPSPPRYILEHLRFRQPDGRIVEQDGRILNLDPRWSPVSRRYADAWQPSGRADEPHR